MSTVVVGMAEMAVIHYTRQAPSVLKTTLGSCVGVLLADRQRQLFGLAHVMLAKNLWGDEASGKYAQTAVPALVSRMRLQGSDGGLEAMLVGGARMFRAEDGSSMAAIGRDNVETARSVLNRLGIPIVFEDTGGEQGRSMEFDCSTGRIQVKTLKKLEVPP